MVAPPALIRPEMASATQCGPGYYSLAIVAPAPLDALALAYRLGIDHSPLGSIEPNHCRHSEVRAMTPPDRSNGPLSSTQVIVKIARALLESRPRNRQSHDMARLALRSPEAFLARPNWQFDLIGVFLQSEASAQLDEDLTEVYEASRGRP